MGRGGKAARRATIGQEKEYKIKSENNQGKVPQQLFKPWNQPTSKETDALDDKNDLMSHRARYMWEEFGRRIVNGHMLMGNTERSKGQNAALQREEPEQINQ